MSDREAAARAFYNDAGGSYPAPEGMLPPAAVAPAAAPVVEAAPAPEPQEPTGPDPLDAMYADVPTRGLVDWAEPVAEARDYDLQAPIGVLDQSDEGRAMLGRLRDGFVAAGAGVTIARELFGDAVRAVNDPHFGTPRALAEAQLRQHFGARYEEQVGLAVGLVQRAAARCPELVPFLDRTGLGNDPEFVKKLATAARRRGAR